MVVTNPTRPTDPSIGKEGGGEVHVGRPRTYFSYWKGLSPPVKNPVPIRSLTQRDNLGGLTTELNKNYICP